MDAPDPEFISGLFDGIYKPHLIRAALLI